MLNASRKSRRQNRSQNRGESGQPEDVNGNLKILIAPERNWQIGVEPRTNKVQFGYDIIPIGTEAPHSRKPALWRRPPCFITKMRCETAALAWTIVRLSDNFTETAPLPHPYCTQAASASDGNDS